MKYNQRFETISTGRLDKKNIELKGKISEKLQEMSNRGIYLSGITLNDVMEIILKSVEVARKIICDTAVEVHQTYYPNEKESVVEEAALICFENQKNTYLSIRAESISKILEELKIDPNFGVSEVENEFEGLRNEIKLTVATHFSKEAKERNLVQRHLHNLKNSRFLAPVIVIAIILIGIAGLIKALSLLYGNGG